MKNITENIMENRSIRNHKDLIVWKKTIDLAVAVYELTEYFPETEIYGLISQMRRSAVSISLNITKGSRRETEEEYHHFLLISFDFVSELETQIEIAKKLPFGRDLDFFKVTNLLGEVARMINNILLSTGK